jgi:N-acetylmuramoyl-L-alanine amidase
VAAAILSVLGLIAAVPMSMDAVQSAAARRTAALLAESQPKITPLEGPITVALQPGHWKIDELPAEQTRRKRGIGAVHAGVRELDINLAVVDALVPMIRRRGWTAIVVPATVPPGLRADAFLSIHADWAADPYRSGWKLAPPWRPSPAASGLAHALRRSFREKAELREDVGGITVGMRGYFGFASHRYTHASSPHTPAVLLELGFVTNEGDRERMVSSPEYYAEIIMDGLERHFYSWARADVASLEPQVFDTLYAGVNGAVVRLTPESDSRALLRLEAGRRVRPVDALQGWYEIRLRNPSVIGWVPSSELSPRVAAAPRAADGPDDDSTTADPRADDDGADT